MNPPRPDKTKQAVAGNTVGSSDPVGLLLPASEEERLEAISNISFGKSEFRGQDKGALLEARRWLVQFVALTIKNCKVLWRQQVYVILFLLLPSCIILTFLGERSYYQGADEVMNLPALDVDSMLGCHTYYQSDCVRIVYAPRRTEVDAVMEEVASMQGFSYGDDVLGFDTNTEAKNYVANNLGRVEYTVFFRDEGNPLWTNPIYATTHPSGSSISTNISSYVIFYNASLNREDGRSKMYDLNVQLLSLQKTIEGAFLKQVYPSTFSEYTLSYGQFWNSSMTLSTARSTNYTAAQQATIATNELCLMGTIKNMNTVGYLLPWVATFTMIFMSVIAYRLLAEERHKDLFGFLRRIGLIDTAYHASWFMTFQVLQLLACGLAMVTMAVIRGQNDYYSPSLAIRKIDYGVMFLLLWLASTCFVSSAFFMASVSTSSNAANAIVFSQFLSAFLTIIACVTPLNVFTADGYTGGSVLGFDCFYVTSSWNTIYSEAGLPGASFVQFLVFFMPWFHLSQALTNIVSVVMYDSEDMAVKLTQNFAAPPLRLSFTPATGTDFSCGWIQQSLEYMVYSTLIFYFVCWFLYQAINSDGSEGRPFLSILVPAFARKYFQKEEMVEEGDVRGEEKSRSAREHSVRGYKISKSYFGGVQALKEVSFDMKRGQIFVLLGHNGAGKSSLINIITGLTASTRGKTFLNGLDIDEDVADIQQSIGVCPQHDILWESLTALDHMLLVAAFKGLSGNNLFSPLYMDASTEEAAAGSPLFASIQNVLKQVQLLDRCKDFASSYSGGMRRRLSVALSTVGDVDVIILDEPTTGLDALTRRRVWETINKLKEGRVVLLTTHNMEEADALGDNIMVLHNGQVRAVGDSLTLKTLYGRGYQVQLEVTLLHMQEFFGLMKKMLPGSQCTNDEEVNPGLVTLTVARGDVRSLPRLFSWLEGSRHSAKFVKEWSVSNTTLEQVFLTLCTQNNTVNFVDGSAELERRQLKLCPMCFSRPREAVIMREYRAAGAGAGAGAVGQVVALPDSVCRVCAESNRFYRVSEQDADRALADRSGATINALVEGAQAACNNEIEEEVSLDFTDDAHEGITATVDAAVPELKEHLVPAPALASATAAGTGDDIPGGAAKPAIEMQLQQSHVAAAHPLARRGFARKDAADGGGTGSNSGRVVLAGSSKRAIQAYAARKYGPRFRGSAGSRKDQMLAIFIKNTRLQSKQRCTNCCSVCYIVTMFIFLYVMSLLIGESLSTFSQCEAGYLTTVGCGLDDLTQHLFFPSSTTVIVGLGSSQDDLGMTNGRDASENGDGYSISTYLVPAEYSALTAGVFTLNGVNKVNGQLPSGGLPVQLQGRPNIIWNSLLSTTNDDLIDSSASTGFGFRSRAPPSDVATGGTAAPNDVQYESQTEANEALQQSASSCWYYIDSSFDIGSSGTPEWRAVELFGATYSDVAIQCPSCVSSAVDVNTTYASVVSRTIAFNGTLWVGKNMNPGTLDGGYTGTCQDFGCFPYGFGFLNVQDTATDSGTQYLYSSTCPTGYGYFSKSPQMEAAQTQVAATYTNLLSNSLVDPLLRNYTIQGAYSPYGTLLMDGYIISTTQSFFLIFFSMVILNGFLHLSAWRYGHEASLELVELTRAMGLQPWVYLLSMFAYDFLISLLTGEVLMGFAVGLELLNFKNAPFGLLSAVVVCSAVAFNGATLLLAKLTNKIAGVMSLVIVCLTLVMAVTSTLLNVQLYAEEGTWPTELSIVPWLAQSRALYIILVYHRSNDEVDASLGLLFAFGFVCIALALALAEKEAVTEFLAEKANIAIDARSDDAYLELITRGPETQMKEAGAETDGRESVTKVRQQLDVAAEKEKARKYIADLVVSSTAPGTGTYASPAHAASAGGDAVVEEGTKERHSRLVTVIYDMKHKYVDNSLSNLIGRIITRCRGNGHNNSIEERSDPSHLDFDEADSDRWAVRGLSLALSLGEVFGLLGTNGAGKSTTISTLIGKIKATYGKQFVAGVDLKHGLSSSVHQFIGICPQFDVTWPDLTVEEHLAFQARQRGIPESKIQAKVQQAAQWVHLDGDAYNTKAAGLSGGMRRRLSIAMALIGDPPIILLDEPTTGLDPDNRQQVWKIIQALRGPDRLILMTTHSMEEAEALCSRIGIVHKGTLRCIGTSQHLKTQFGKGFTLTVNSLSKEAAVFAAIDEHVIRDVARGKASLLSRINCTTRYLINKEADGGGVGMSEIFQKMEQKKGDLQIREWGLAMTTLEEVFISAVSDD